MINLPAFLFEPAFWIAFFGTIAVLSIGLAWRVLEPLDDLEELSNALEEAKK